MLVIARSAGIDAVVSPELDSSDSDFDSRFRGILREMGLSPWLDKQVEHQSSRSQRCYADRAEVGWFGTAFTNMD